MLFRSALFLRKQEYLFWVGRRFGLLDVSLYVFVGPQVVTYTPGGLAPPDSCGYFLCGQKVTKEPLKERRKADAAPELRSGTTSAVAAP